MDFKTLTGPSRGGTNSLLLVSGPNAIKLATAISEDPQKGFNVVSNLGGQATKGFIDGMKGKSVGHAIVNLVPHPDSGQESYGSIYSKLAGTEATFAGFSGFL